MNSNLWYFSGTVRRCSPDKQLSVGSSCSLVIRIKNTNSWTCCSMAMETVTGPKKRERRVSGAASLHWTPLDDMCTALSRRDAVQYLLRWNNTVQCVVIKQRGFWRMCSICYLEQISTKLKSQIGYQCFDHKKFSSSFNGASLFGVKLEKLPRKFMQTIPAGVLFSA